MFSINGIILYLFLLNYLNNLVICQEPPKYAVNNDQMNQSNSDFFKWYNESLADCRKALDSLIAIPDLTKMLQDVYYIDAKDGIHLKGDITFDSLTVIDTLRAPDVKSQENFSYGRIFDTKFGSIANSLETIEREAEKLDDVLEAAMKTNGNQLVSGNLTFANAYFNCGSDGCNIKSIETSTFNGRNVDKLSENVYRLNKDEELIDSFNFSSMIVDNIDVDLINNISPRDIVTRDGNHTITGDVTFEDSVSVNQLNVKRTVNGHEINRKTVLTTTDSQSIISPVSFTHDIIVNDLNVEHLPQLGSDVDTFLSDIVQADREHTITGKKTFINVILDNLLVEGGSINGFNLTALCRHLLTRDNPQTIEAHVNVDELIVNGYINVDKINGNRLEEVVVRRSVPTVIRGDKVFTGPVRVKTMLVDGILNGHRVNDRSLGLMLKTGSQVITGQKDFRDIVVNNISVFHGNVGRLNVEILKKNLERKIEGGRQRVLSGPIHLEDIEVEGLVNGINLTSLMNDYLKVNQTVVPNVNLNIAKASFNQPLRCDRINDLKFPDDFLTINTDQFIKGNTYTSSNLMVTSSLNLTYVNGYNVDDTLWDSLTSTRDQIIKAFKIINGNLFVKNLNVASLNNITMKDLVLLNGNGIILGNKTFSSINIASPSSVDSINGVKTINRIAFDELFSNSITKRNYQSISPNIHVKKLIIPLGTNVNVTELAGMKLDDILSSVVYLRSNVTQIVRGRKRFTSQATFGNLEFTSTFSGYSKDDFHRKYLNASPSEIKGDISINSDVFIEKDLIVTGKVNELNIDSLSRHLPVNGKPIIINRPMSFRYVRVIDGNVAAPTINGLKFGQEMITRNSSITFFGNASFPHGVTVNNLTVGSINNVKIEGSVCNPIQNVFTRPYSLTITGNVIATSSIQSRKVHNLIFNRQTTNLIKGVKNFKKLNIKGPINLTGRLNNLDVKYLQRNYLSRTKDQTIDSEVILRNATFSGPVFIGGHLSGRNVYTNGFDIEKVASTMLKNTGDQSIKDTFYFPGRVIFQKGLINSPLITLNEKTINLTSDIFLKSRQNTVNSKIVFENVHTDDLKTYERSNLYRDLNNINNQITQFYGRKNFTSLEIDDLVVDQINGIPVKSLLRSDADANITGTVAVNSDLVIKPNFTVIGTVNGIKLQLLGSKLVLVGENNTITAPLTLRTKPTIRSLEVPGPWKRSADESQNDLLIPEKLRSFRDKLASHRRTLKDITNRLDKEKPRSQETQEKSKTPNC